MKNNMSMMTALDESLRALAEAREHDPFRRLGLHRTPRGWRLRVFRPGARSVALESGNGALPLPLHRMGNSDFFEWEGSETPRLPYKLRVEEGGRVLSLHDPYAFPPRPSDHDLFLFSEGSNSQAYR